MSVYDYTIKNAKDKDVKLSEYEGKVLMIVNTATKCGFTPQYDDIEKIYEKYHDQGFEVIDIPCNQFADQAPGTEEEIKGFCQARFNTKFSPMKKSDVNGENELPLYTYLKSQKGFEGFNGPTVKKWVLEQAVKKNGGKDRKENSDIKWNFTKFIIDRQGNVVERFEPTRDMAEVDKLIGELIQE